jgi:hypothetical protein
MLLDAVNAAETTSRPPINPTRNQRSHTVTHGPVKAIEMLDYEIIPLAVSGFDFGNFPSAVSFSTPVQTTRLDPMSTSDTGPFSSSEICR